MKRAPLVLLAVAALAAPGMAVAGTLDPVAKNEAAPTLVQQPQNSFFLAQTLDPSLTGNLDQVDLRLSDGGADPATPLHVEIQSVSSGQPAGTTLTTTDVPAASVPASADWVSIPISPTVPVDGSGSGQLAIVVRSDEGGAGGLYSWHAVDPGPYSGGSAFTRSTGALTWTQASYDFNFRVYIAGATVATFRGATAARTAKGVVVRWRTAPLLDTLGYHVYREVNGKRVRANTRIIPANASGSYAFLDRTRVRGALRYWVQSVNPDGSRRWHLATSH